MVCPLRRGGTGRVIGRDPRLRPIASRPCEIVDFENTFLLCYVRGPEGLIVELAERLDGAPR